MKVNKVFFFVSLFCMAAPVFAAEEAAAPVSGAVAAVVKTGSLSVRDNPSLDGHIIGKLKNGDIVQVVAHTADRQWYKIIFKAAAGAWVSARFAALSGSVDALPVAGGSVSVPASLSGAGGKTETMKISLDKLAPFKSVDLRCINGGYTVSVPVPERWKVKRVVLNISYVNSSNLIADNSQLIVRFDNSILGQTKLFPLAPEGKMNLSIPASLMDAGYHDLGLQAVQHYTHNCEQFCAPDLWTTVNLEKSFLEIEYILKPIPLKLSEISNFLFDHKILPAGNVNIVIENLSSEKATLAGIAASGIARRFDYRKVYFNISTDIKAGYDNVIVGDKKFVQALLKKNSIGPLMIEGPFLKIMPLPAANSQTGTVQIDPLHGLLVVSGSNVEEIKVAAATFANITIPYPGTDEMTAKQFNMPDISLYSGKRVLSSDKTYTFKKLDFTTHTFEGFSPAPMDIRFRLPADFLIKPNQYAKIVLNFTYGAGMRSDSVLNIMLNGNIIRVIPLNNPAGDYIEGYRVELPTYLFKTGSNTIKFIPILNPVAKECDIIRDEGFFLTIFDNSTLHFPSMPHLIEMPKIELFMLDGFPFTRWPDGLESIIYITSKDLFIAEAALNIIGIITQKSGFPLSGLKVSFERPNWDGEIIVIGDSGTIPEDFLKGAPLRLAKESTVPYPVARGWKAESSLASSRQISGLGPNTGAVMEFQSPYKKGRTALLFTGASKKELLSLSHALMEPGVGSQMKGDLNLIDLNDPPNYKVNAISAGERYFTGKAGRISKIDYYLYTYPYLAYLAVALLVLILSLALFLILKRYRAKRIFNEDADKTD
ncbi:MAG: cellulose biosynthesis cyclic di-GMP-binding regulatory protein BcsB [Deltaproteobacteria bacterium]|nr:cellulose biosynthesis cyclic di-GMP-binding regulatory protein BcsB [Deltaproteobacteria bacterium]